MANGLAPARWLCCQYLNPILRAAARTKIGIIRILRGGAFLCSYFGYIFRAEMHSKYHFSACLVSNLFISGLRSHFARKELIPYDNDAILKCSGILHRESQDAFIRKSSRNLMCGYDLIQDISRKAIEGAKQQ